MMYVLLWQITIMRPPNYTMLTLWALVVIVVLVFAYWRRENLSIIYNSQNWAFLAIVCDLQHNYKILFLHGFLFVVSDTVHGVWSNVEPYQRTPCGP